MAEGLTLLVSRVHPLATDYDLFDFFSQAGTVTDVRLIRDARSGKSRGVAYVEMDSADAAYRALALNGVALRSLPLLVQPSMAERNRLAVAAKEMAKAATAAASQKPSRLLVTELHPQLAADDLRDIFAGFGAIRSVELAELGGTAATAVAHVHYEDADAAAAAMEALNGLELGGRPIALQLVRELPPALRALQPPPPPPPSDNGETSAAAGSLPPISSTALQLSNVFAPADSAEHDDPDYVIDVCEDVVDECAKHGSLVSLKVALAAPGRVCVRFAEAEAAAAARDALHGRWFAGRRVAAEGFAESDFDSLPSWPPS